jgi:CRP/FNR family transcriptional regulator
MSRSGTPSDELNTVAASPVEVAAAMSLLAAYPDLVRITDPVWLSAVTRATHHHFRANTTLFESTAPSNEFHLIVRGTVRVYYPAPDGREITLYQMNPGDLCILSLNNLLRGRRFDVVVQSRTDVHALCISAADFEKCLAGSPAFRAYVLSTLVGRLCQLMCLVQDAVFQNLDARLACLLGRLAEREGSDVLSVTHQELAQELGTTREVVSRILREFERNGYLRLTRGQIELSDEASLAKLGRCFELV